ncbi:MAG: hypothetical protein Q9225_002734 [Loekoesia sp. 1 TL-2023]
MARSDEAQWWFNAVYEAVQQIPHGRVTSYGHIALLLGRRNAMSSVSDLPSDHAKARFEVILTQETKTSRDMLEASTFLHR